MSNSLAVAMVTAALRRMLGEALVAVPAGGVQNAQVTTLRPDMLSALPSNSTLMPRVRMASTFMRATQGIVARAMS